MVFERNFARITGQTYEELLASLIESARLISGKLSLDELADIIVVEAQRLFDAKAGWLFLYDSKDDLLKIERFWGPSEEVFRAFSVRPGEGISGIAFLTQQPEVTLKAEKYLALIPTTTILPDDAPALAVFPLSVGGRRIGVIGITSETISKKGLTEDEFNSVVSAFANHIAIALDTALLFEEKKKVELELKNSVQRLQMINEIGIDLIRDLDLAVIIRKVARYTTDIFGTDAAIINLGNKDGTVIEAAYFYNMPPETEEILLTKQTIARRVFEYPRRVLINDYPVHTWALPEFIEVGVKSLIMVPVISRGRVLATLSAVSFREERAFAEDDFDELEFVARHVAVAIENARLYYEQVETRRKMEDYATQLRMLNDFSQRVTSESNPQEMAEQLAKSARILLNCTVSGVILFRNSMDEAPTLSWSTDGNQSCKVERLGVDFSTHDGLYSELFRTKKPIRLNNISAHPHSKGLPEHHMPICDVLGVPLLDSNDEFIGQVMVSD
ncbi:MAG: GAF domain-containing protein, partial [Candidatus Aquicultor sp.]